MGSCEKGGFYNVFFSMLWSASALESLVFLDDVGVCPYIIHSREECKIKSPWKADHYFLQKSVERVMKEDGDCVVRRR